MERALSDTDFHTARGQPPRDSSHDFLDEIVRFNVGGRIFAFCRQTLLRHPSTLLGQLATCNNRKQEELICPKSMDNLRFFERSAEYFERCVASLYIGDGAHIPPTVCYSAALSELRYWRLTEEMLAHCCKNKLISCDASDASQTMTSVTAEASRPCDSLLERNGSYNKGHEPSVRSVSVTNEKALKTCGISRELIWDTFETPGSNGCSWFIMCLSMVMVMTTMVTLVLSSMETFKVPKNATNYTAEEFETRRLRETLIDIVDCLCVIYFTVEYLIRLAAAPDRLGFLRSSMSLVDVLAFLPFYIELALNQGNKSGDFGTISRSFVFIRILRVLRIMRAIRILKVARYSTGFKSMGATLKRSWHELTLLIMFMLTANFIFSTAMYFIEEDEPDTYFHSIPDACWWCIITMTTVGYGDVYPRSWIGKVLAGVVSTIGIILLAFPVSIMIETFNEEYEKKREPKGKRHSAAHDELDRTEARVFNGRVYLPLDVVEGHMAAKEAKRHRRAVRF